MREISRDEYKLTLDLFVIAWFGWPMPKSENQYNLINDEWSLMNRLKDAFPMDEINKHELISTGVTYMEDGSPRLNYIVRSYNFVEEV